MDGIVGFKTVTETKYHTVKRSDQVQCRPFSFLAMKNVGRYERELANANHSWFVFESNLSTVLPQGKFLFSAQNEQTPKSC